MSDCISRQAVLEQINCWIGSGEYRYAMSERFLIDRIKTLSPVNPQEPKADVLDKMRAEIEREYNKYRNMSEIWDERACGIGMALEIIDKYREQEPKTGIG